MSIVERPWRQTPVSRENSNKNVPQEQNLWIYKAAITPGR